MVRRLLIMSPTVGKGAISVAFVRPSVRPSVCLSLRPSVAYIVNNWRTQRPSVPKFGMKVPHFIAQQFRGQTVKGQGFRLAGAYRVGRTRQPHCLCGWLAADCTVLTVVCMQAVGRIHVYAGNAQRERVTSRRTNIRMDRQTEGHCHCGEVWPYLRGGGFKLPEIMTKSVHVSCSQCYPHVSSVSSDFCGRSI